jgi:arabinose-5-phosphate isomerase
MVTSKDSILALSNSGESEEVVRLLPSLLRMAIPIAAITSKPESSLGQAATWTFSYQLPQGEGCPLDLAPMASTTLQLIWGDVLASALMARSGFTRDLFALNHPAGSIGLKIMKVNVLMHKFWPRVRRADTLMEVLKVMTEGHLGMTTVMDGPDLAGVITDGDIRRALEKTEKEGGNPLELDAARIMTTNPATIDENDLALDAAGQMETRKITFLIVTRKGSPCGVLHIHDLLEAKVL